MGTNRETIGRNAGVRERNNLLDREQVREVASGLNTIPIGGTWRERNATRNDFGLLNGSTGPSTIERDGTYIKAIAPGATIERHLRINSKAIITDVRFVQDGSDDGPLVTIGPEAKVMFNWCMFDKRTKSDAIYIDVETGGQAIFIGGWLTGTPFGTGSPINNPAPAAPSDIKVIGMFNCTGRPIKRCTLIGVIE